MGDNKEVKSIAVACNHCELVMEKTDDGYACKTIGCGKVRAKGEGEFIMEQDKDGVFLIRTRQPKWQNSN